MFFALQAGAVTMTIVSLAFTGQSTEGIRKISASGGCSILEDDTVICNRTGEFSLPSGIVPRSVSSWYDPSIGAGEVCIVSDTNEIYCGSNSVSRVDLGGFSAKEVSAGDNFTCALSTDGQVRCWGSAEGGRLGPGTPTSGSVAPGPSLQSIDFGTDRLAQQLYSRRWRSCVVLDDGSVRCWGDSFNGATGDPQWNGESGDSWLPLDFAGKKAVRLSLAEFSGCGLFDNGQVECFGLGTVFRKGSNDGSPVDFGSRQPLAIGSMRSGTCAALSDESLVCWGFPFNLDELGMPEEVVSMTMPENKNVRLRNCE